MTFSLHRKEKIIITAIDILDKFGLQGLTIKRIAEEQGITEPAIYRQFKGKQDIIMAILDRYAQYDVNIQNTIIEQEMDTNTALIYYAERYAEYYENDRGLSIIMFSFDIYRYNKENMEKMKQILKTRYDFVKGIIEKGQEKKEIDDDISADELTDLFNGIIWSLTYKWNMFGCNGLGNRIKRGVKKLLGISKVCR
ncbi:MAG: TetR/AcrR family transcriptional regulator [Clostridia bacterium]|nr:TetR/AcrR family transcriptional regulator [Clostridia bacterium]